MPLGAHLPTSKGFIAALEHAQELDCDCLQIFLKSPRVWQASPIDAAKALAFRARWEQSGFAPLVAHDSYLINLASADPIVRDKSLAAMIDEVERADLLGCNWLVTHCGAHGGTVDRTPGRAPISLDEEAGLGRFASALLQVLEATPDARVKIALENTAAQGTCLGGPFEHLKYLQERLPPERIGFCFDTCHALAAGHDLSSPESVEETLRELDSCVGLKTVAVVHLNDSKGERGGRLDRHEHIGLGRIGPDGMRAILNHPVLKSKPFILETPDSETHLASNLDNVRALRSGAPLRFLEPAQACS
jgi:deoxyribonuclease-4